MVPHTSSRAPHWCPTGAPGTEPWHSGVRAASAHGSISVKPREGGKKVILLIFKKIFQTSLWNS